MHNTIGDVLLTSFSRETKYFHELVQYPEQRRNQGENLRLETGGGEMGGGGGAVLQFISDSIINIGELKTLFPISTNSL